MKLSVHNQSGQKTTGTVELDPRVFDPGKIRPEVTHFVATAIQSSRRHPIASTKTRGLVRGGGRKPWRQKGTGRARAGSIRSPLWRGGGVVFGPTPRRNFFKKLNRKVKRLGLFSALSDRVAEGRVIILDKLELTEGKTRKLLANLDTLKPLLKGKKVLIVIPARDEKLYRASKNLADIEVLEARNLNILNVLRADDLVILKDALPVISKTFLRS